MEKMTLVEYPEINLNKLLVIDKVRINFELLITEETWKKLFDNGKWRVKPPF